MTNILTKVAQILRDFWALLKTSLIKKANTIPGYVLGQFWKYWATFYSDIWSHWSQIIFLFTLEDALWSSFALLKITTRVLYKRIEL